MYNEIETDLNEPNTTVFYEDPDRDKNLVSVLNR